MTVELVVHVGWGGRMRMRMVMVYYIEATHFINSRHYCGLLD